MIPINEYPVFEADQVLTADHLNQLFDYLDEQNRLTRTCLIGIGIVCGLDSYYENNSITITAGVGVTSLGYLINFNGGTYTYARTYNLPDSVAADEKAFYGDMDMWQLFTPDADNPLTVDDEVLSDTGFLQDKVVILLLELDIENLKNCTTNDCDDKGSRAELNVRPLLVSTEDLSTFTYTGFETDKAALPDIVLKRYNVPFKELKSPTDVLNAFYAITDATSLAKIADGYSKAYETYKTMLPAENFNPFTNLLATLNTQLNDVKTNSYVFTEYYYDYIDDLVKAYNEFREKGDTLLVACCPDENLFPYHLALCEALGDSRSTASAYRNYFIHSPVFGEQKALAGELQQLFTRMKLLVEKFTIPGIASTRQPVIKITPGEYGKYYLSERAIPYYYDPLAVLNSWNYEKTRKGKASKNLSYHSDKYSSDDKVVNPLLYELEPYNFFRVEGHIGTNINFALANIVSKKQQFSLPFDVIALNVAENSKITNQNLTKCYFHDLESLYNVLIAELLCKLNQSVCLLAGLPYIVDFSTNIAGTGKINLAREKAGLSNANDPKDASAAASYKASMSDFRATMKIASANQAAASLAVYTVQSQSFIDEMKYIHPYKKGTYLKEFCDPKPFGNYKSIGEYYLEAVSKSGATFPKPPDTVPADSSARLYYMYMHIFYFIDCVEEMLATILPYYLHNINFSTFEYRYQLMVDEAKAFSAFISSDDEEENDIIVDMMMVVINLCIDEQIKTLLDEYNKRLKQISLERLFAAYTKTHSGIDHKAGVTRGGTFILVYEEKARVQFRTPGRVIVEAPQPQVVVATENAFAKEAAGVSAIAAENTAGAVNDAACAQQFINLNKYKLTEEEYAIVTGLISKIDTTEGKPVDTFVIGENIVFADFFLPYLCCSDCAPISYIIQETPPDEPVEFGIEPNKFLYDDAHNYPFTAEPLPADVNEVTNPDNLKLLIENDTLFLHPAIPELTQTLVTRLTYKGIDANITIVRPDATFTAEVVTDPANGVQVVQVSAKFKDADQYDWKVNGKDNVFESKADPAPVNLITEFPGTSEFEIELTVTYKLNDVISTDTKKQKLTLATGFCIDFEEPEFKIGTIYGGQAGQKPGDVAFTSHKTVVRVIEFKFTGEGGSFNFGGIVQTPTPMGTGQSLSVNNINFEFDFSESAFLPSKVTVDFLDQGGFENLSVNGSDIFAGELTAAPATLGGVSVSASKIPGSGMGTLTLTGEIKIFAIGGQEFTIDNVCVS